MYLYSDDLQRDIHYMIQLRYSQMVQVKGPLLEHFNLYQYCSLRYTLTGLTRPQVTLYRQGVVCCMFLLYYFEENVENRS